MAIVMPSVLVMVVMEMTLKVAMTGTVLVMVVSNVGNSGDNNEVHVDSDGAGDCDHRDEDGDG